MKITNCAGCKPARYCSKACQTEMWRIHKAECLERQGKDVPPDIREDAEAELALRLSNQRIEEEDNYE